MKGTKELEQSIEKKTELLPVSVRYQQTESPQLKRYNIEKLTIVHTVSLYLKRYNLFSD